MSTKWVKALWRSEAATKGFCLCSTRERQLYKHINSVQSVKDDREWYEDCVNKMKIVEVEVNYSHQGQRIVSHDSVTRGRVNKNNYSAILHYLREGNRRKTATYIYRRVIYENWATIMHQPGHQSSVRMFWPKVTR